MKKLLKHLPLHCPACSNKLIIKNLGCIHCKTEVNGFFDLPLLANLSQNEQNFIINFVKSSGSLKEMAKLLNLSYPSVRNMLDDLIDKIKLSEREREFRS